MQPLASGVFGLELMVVKMSISPTSRDIVLAAYVFKNRVLDNLFILNFTSVGERDCS